MDELRHAGRGRHRRRRPCSRRCSTGPATSPSCGSADPQDETRVENLAELVAVAREFEEANRRAARLADFLEQVALVADADQIPDEPTRPRTAGRGHADDAAHRQGPGVPGRVPHRPGGRRLPAPAVARRPDASWRRSAGWPTSASPGPASGSTCPGPPCAARGARRSTTRPSRFLEEIPAELVDWRRARVVGAPATPAVAARRGPPRRAVTGQPGRRAPRAGRPGHPRHVRHGHGRRRRGRGRAGGGARRLRRPAGSSGCCCATPRSRSSEPAGAASAQTWTPCSRSQVSGGTGVAVAGADLEVQVRAGGVAGGADPADRRRRP